LALKISVKEYRCNSCSQDVDELGAFYLFNAHFFATQIIGGAKELVVLYIVI